MSALINSLSCRMLSSVKSLSNISWSRFGVNTASNTVNFAGSTCYTLGRQQTRFGHTFPQFVNLPPVNPIAGKGDAFTTQIVRKRVVKDPNLPNFEHIEPLKWATWRMLREVRRRHIFGRYFFNRHCLFNIHQNRMLPQSIRDIALEEEIKGLPRDSTFQHLRNRCAITGRSRGLVKRYRLSRLVFRNQADYNKLYGVNRACWN